ncbi:MAG: T9SS type A sorting domain-containing protein [Flavobacteriales bacterium]|nr:T9SS type A sorting domain-containing protein [Flavobacteriales bacterium]
MFKKLIYGKLFALSLTSLFFTLPQNLEAQSTWSAVHAILQTNCGSSSCHDPGTPIPLTLIGTESDIYNNLVNVAPDNPDAVASGYMQVDPGHPHLSFLLKKMNNGLDPDNGLDNVAQGGPMPKGAPGLSDSDIDLISAWILHGAPQTGNVVDAQLINDFHAGGGLAPVAPIAAPDPSEGFQIHFGSVFIAPGAEREFFLKKKLPNVSQAMEITRLETYIDLESHHYILYKFDSQADADAVPQGLREVTGITEAFVNGTSMVAAWQNASDIILPEGTAYFWDPGTTLDLNLHIRNYSPDSILKAEVYTNVYLQPKQTSTIEMISDLSLFSTLPLDFVPCGANPFCIPNDGQDHTFTGDITGANLSSGGADSLYVWLLSSHTHKFGVGYDIYLRNPGGGKGQQVYDGNYNFEYTFDQGFYDFEDPAVRFFDPDTFVVNANDGFIHEATFNNNGNQDVGFGITTSDEMMLVFFQYTTSRPTIVGVKEQVKQSNLTVYPNPAIGDMPISFVRSNASNEDYIALYDLLGKEVLVQKFPNGSKQLFLDRSSLNAGVYMYKAWSLEGNAASGKLIIY